MAHKNPNFVNFSGDLRQLLLFKSALQTHIYQFLGGSDNKILPGLTSPQDIPLTIKTEAIACCFDSALVLRLKEPANRPQILATFQQTWFSSCPITPKLTIPLPRQILPNNWLRFLLSYHDLLPWWQAIALELDHLPSPDPTARGITAPAPWGIYQYVHVQLAHWQQLHPLPPPAPEEPTILSPLHQQLWQEELTLIEVLTAPDPSPLALHPLIMSLCAGAIVLVNHPLPEKGGQGAENSQIWSWGLVSLGKYLLGELLAQLGPGPAPHQL